MNLSASLSLRSISETGTKTIKIVFTLTAILLALFFISPASDGGDFAAFYYAGATLLRGQSVYTIAGYYSPIGVALLIAPLTIFPLLTAFKVFEAVSVALFCAVFFSLTDKWPILLLAVLSPFVLLVLQWGNIEAIVMAALLAPAPLAVLLALLKPQMGAFLAIYILWREWRAEGVKRALIVAAPAALMYAVSFALDMFARPMPINAAWNISIFPFGVPVALWLMWRAFMRRDESAALAATVFTSPYVCLSWAALIPASLRSWKWAAVLFVAMWAYVIVRANV